MRKLFKKALACCLVAALALTCFVGALSVNAETAAALTGKIEVGTVEVADDATTATVPVVITSDNALNAAKITVAASEGWEVSAIAIDAASTAAKIEPENINGDTFIVEALDNIAGFTTATVNVTFTSKVAVAATITATLDPVHAATWNEDVVNLAVTDGAITVKAAVVEPTKTYVEFTPGHVLNLQNSIELGFTVPKDIFAGYTNKVYAIVTKKFYSSATEYEVLTYPIDAVDYVKDTTKYLFAFKNISAREMGTTVEVVFYGEDANGNILYSNTERYSVADYAIAALNTYSKHSKYAGLCTTVVEMVNYGSEAETYFKYKTPTPILSLADFSAYDSFRYTGDANMVVVDDAGTPGAVALGRTLSLGASVAMTATFEQAAIADYDDVSVVFTKEDGSVLQTVTSDKFVVNGTKFYANCDVLTTTQMNMPVKFTLYSGETAISNTRTYTIATYADSASKQTASAYATLKALTKQMMMFATAAENYFGK